MEMFGVWIKLLCVTINYEINFEKLRKCRANRMVVDGSTFSNAQNLLNHDAHALVVSITPYEPLVDQNEILGHPAAIGSHAMSSPVPLEKASIKSSFDRFRAEGSMVTLAKIGCLLETSTEAECLFSEGSHAGEPLISLGKADIEGDSVTP